MTVLFLPSPCFPSYVLFLLNSKIASFGFPTRMASNHSSMGLWYWELFGSHRKERLVDDILKQQKSEAISTSSKAVIKPLWAAYDADVIDLVNANDVAIATQQGQNSKGRFGEQWPDLTSSRVSVRNQLTTFITCQTSSLRLHQSGAWPFSMTARVTMALEPASAFQRYWMCENMSLGEFVYLIHLTSLDFTGLHSAYPITITTNTIAITATETQ